MENARREQSRASLSIHLVPKKGSNTAVLQDVSADPLQSLSRREPQPGSAISIQFSSADHGSTVSRGLVSLSVLDPVTVLRELFELLEDYSPVWYSEENHNRAVAALKLATR